MEKDEEMEEVKREEAKKCKISERMVNRITGSS
jgi:hypothetical protein